MRSSTLVDDPSTTGLEVEGGMFAQPDVSRPRFKQVISAIMAETRCSFSRAKATVDMLVKARNQIRLYGGVYHLTQRELVAIHPVLRVIMPDDQVAPREASAHALINRRYLSGAELTFEHTRDGREIVYCAIAVRVRSA